MSLRAPPRRRVRVPAMSTIPAAAAMPARGRGERSWRAGRAARGGAVGKLACEDSYPLHPLIGWSARLAELGEQRRADRQHEHDPSGEARLGGGGERVSVLARRGLEAVCEVAQQGRAGRRPRRTGAGCRPPSRPTRASPRAGAGVRARRQSARRAATCGRRRRAHGPPRPERSPPRCPSRPAPRAPTVGDTPSRPARTTGASTRVISARSGDEAASQRSSSPG